MGAACVWKISVLSSQFCYRLKTALENSLICVRLAVTRLQEGTMVPEGSDDLDGHLHGSHWRTETSHPACRCGRASPGAHTWFQGLSKLGDPSPTIWKWPCHGKEGTGDHGTASTWGVVTLSTEAQACEEEGGPCSTAATVCVRHL